MVQHAYELFRHPTGADRGEHVLDAFTFDTDKGGAFGAFTGETEVTDGEMFGENGGVVSVGLNEREHIGTGFFVLPSGVRAFFLTVVDIDGGKGGHYFRSLKSTPFLYRPTLLRIGTPLFPRFFFRTLPPRRLRAANLFSAGISQPPILRLNLRLREYRHGQIPEVAGVFPWLRVRVPTFTN